MWSIQILEQKRIWPLNPIQEGVGLTWTDWLDAEIYIVESEIHSPTAMNNQVSNQMAYKGSFCMD